MATNNKKMDRQFALEILTGVSGEIERFDEAFEYMKRFHGSDAEFVRLFSSDDGNVNETLAANKKLALAEAQFSQAYADRDFEKLYEISEITGDPNHFAKAEEVFEEYKAAHSLQDDKARAMHMRLIQNEFDKMNIGILRAADSELRELIEGITVINNEEKGADGKFKKFNAAEKTAALEKVLAAVQEDVLMDNYAKKEVFLLDARARYDFLAQEVQIKLKRKLVTAVAAYQDKMNGKTKTTDATIRQFFEDARNGEEKLLNTWKAKIIELNRKGKAYFVDQGALIFGAVDTALRMEKEMGREESRGFKSSTRALAKRYKAFTETMKDFWKGAWDKRYEFARSAYASRYRIAGTVVGGLAMAGGAFLSSPVAIGIATGYAFWRWADSNWGALVEKRERLKNEARAKGDMEQLAKLEGLKFWSKKNFKSGMGDMKVIREMMGDRERERYISRRKWGFIAGAATVATFGLVSPEVGMVTKRFISSTIRSLGTAALNYLFMHKDNKAFKEDQSEENKNNRTASRWAFGLSAGASVLGIGAGVIRNFSEITGWFSGNGNGGKVAALAEQSQQPAEKSDIPVTSWKNGKGLTTVEENGKLVIKDGDGKVIVSENTKNISGWADKTDEDKAKYVQGYMNSTQGAIDDQAVLNNFKDFLPTKNGKAFIPTTATEAGMTEHEWKVFNQRLVGIIGTQEGAEHIGVVKLGEDLVREEALMNLMRFMKDNPDAFPVGSNPLKILDSGLESHYYSVGHGYFDGDGHWIAEKYNWVEIDGKEVEVMGRFAKVGDGDTYGRVTGDYLRLNGQKLKIEDGFVTIKGEKVAVETGYAKVGDQMVKFDGKSDITIGNDSYTVSSKWVYGDSSNEAQMNTFMNIICGKKYNAGDVATMEAVISKLNAEAAQAYATGEGNNAVGIGRNCDEVTVFKFSKKHIPVHHNTPAPAPEPETRTVVTDTAVAKEVETRTVVTDTAVEKPAPEPKETKTYIVFNREAVNPKSLDQYEAPGHQKLNGATVIRVKTRE